jgi:hypothetical protein
VEDDTVKSSDAESRSLVTTRRAVIRTGARLAYAAPVVAVSISLGNASTSATECFCPTGAVAVPDWVIDTFKKWKWYELANLLKGKCVGCSKTDLDLPTEGAILEACHKIGKSYSRLCPGAGNKVVLKERLCEPVISR